MGTLTADTRRGYWECKVSNSSYTDERWNARKASFIITDENLSQH